MMEELVGERNFKPFECIGTAKESLVAFYLSLQRQSENPPVLLRYFQEKILPKYKNLKKESEEILHSWNSEHFIPLQFAALELTISEYTKND